MPVLTGFESHFSNQQNWWPRLRKISGEARFIRVYCVARTSCLTELAGAPVSTAHQQCFCKASRRAVPYASAASSNDQSTRGRCRLTMFTTTAFSRLAPPLALMSCASTGSCRPAEAPRLRFGLLCGTLGRELPRSRLEARSPSGWAWVPSPSSRVALR